MCGMRVRRVGHYQTLETAVRGIEARFRRSDRQELSPRSDENPIYAAISRTLFHRAGKKQWERCLKGRVGEIKALLWWHRDEWCDLWNLSLSSDRRRPLRLPGFQTTGITHSRKSIYIANKHNIDVLLAWRAKPDIVSEFCRLRSSSRKHCDLSESCYYSHLHCKWAMDRISRNSISTENFLRYIAYYDLIKIYRDIDKVAICNIKYSSRALWPAISEYPRYILQHATILLVATPNIAIPKFARSTVSPDVNDRTSLDCASNFDIASTTIQQHYSTLQASQNHNINWSIRH